MNSTLKKTVLRLTNIDRRYIFAAIFIAVALPFFLPISFKAEPGTETIKFDNALTGIISQNRPVVVDVDFGPQTMAEMEPMLLALLNRLFTSKTKVIFITFMTEAASPVRSYLALMEKKYNLKYGKDYVFLGYASAYAYTMNGLNNSFKAYFHFDDRGNPIDNLPIMKSVKSLKDTSGVINIASNAFPRFWIQYAVTPYSINFLAGTTAVNATEYYPFLQTGQLKGLLAGGKAAAEYESLLVKNNILKSTGDASKGLGSQSLAIIVILIFIVIGNIGYFARRNEG